MKFKLSLILLLELFFAKLSITRASYGTLDRDSASIARDSYHYSKKPEEVEIYQDILWPLLKHSHGHSRSEEVNPKFLQFQNKLVRHLRSLSLPAIAGELEQHPFELMYFLGKNDYFLKVADKEPWDHTRYSKKQLIKNFKQFYLSFKKTLKERVAPYAKAVETLANDIEYKPLASSHKTELETIKDNLVNYQHETSRIKSLLGNKQALEKDLSYFILFISQDPSMTDLTQALSEILQRSESIENPLEEIESLWSRARAKAIELFSGQTIKELDQSQVAAATKQFEKDCWFFETESKLKLRTKLLEDYDFNHESVYEELSSLNFKSIESLEKREAFVRLFFRGDTPAKLTHSTITHLMCMPTQEERATIFKNLNGYFSTHLDNLWSLYLFLKGCMNANLFEEGEKEQYLKLLHKKIDRLSKQQANSDEVILKILEAEYSRYATEPNYFWGIFFPKLSSLTSKIEALNFESGHDPSNTDLVFKLMSRVSLKSTELSVDHVAILINKSSTFRDPAKKAKALTFFKKVLTSKFCNTASGIAKIIFVATNDQGGIFSSRSIEEEATTSACENIDRFLALNPTLEDLGHYLSRTYYRLDLGKKLQVISYVLEPFLKSDLCQKKNWEILRKFTPSTISYSFQETRQLSSLWQGHYKKIMNACMEAPEEIDQRITLMKAHLFSGFDLFIYLENSGRILGDSTDPQVWEVLLRHMENRVPTDHTGQIATSEWEAFAKKSEAIESFKVKHWDAFVALAPNDELKALFVKNHSVNLPPKTHSHLDGIW